MFVRFFVVLVSVQSSRPHLHVRAHARGCGRALLAHMPGKARDLLKILHQRKHADAVLLRGSSRLVNPKLRNSARINQKVAVCNLNLSETEG